jgi:hypothetical protein
MYTVLKEGTPMDAGYRRVMDESLAAGDEAYTWTTPACTELGWVPVEARHAGELVTRAMVPIRRKVMLTGSFKEGFMTGWFRFWHPITALRKACNKM